MVLFSWHGNALETGCGNYKCLLLSCKKQVGKVVTILYNILISNFQIKNVSLLRSCSETPNTLIYFTEVTEGQ